MQQGNSPWTDFVIFNVDLHVNRVLRSANAHVLAAVVVRRDAKKVLEILSETKGLVWLAS